MRLISVDFPTVSPLDHWPRSLFMIFFGAVFAVISLKLLRSVLTGATLVLDPQNPLASFRIIPGKSKLAKTDIKHGLLSSYNGPFSTAFLGLLFYLAAQLFIVMMFKTVDYTFT